METLTNLSKSDTLHKVPPHDIAVEQSLLGSIVINDKNFLEVIYTLTPKSFYIPKHRIIFEAMVEINKRGDAVDAVTLSAQLQNKDDLEKIGGSEYLAELVDSAPTTSNLESYAKIVQEKFVRRKLVNAGATIADYGYQEDQSLEKLIDSSERELFEITHKHVSVGYHSIEQSIGPIVENIMNLANSDSSARRGISSGFDKLDEALSGFQPSDLIIIAARPSVGKTTLALDIARLASVRHGTPVGIFSLEMSETQLLERMLATEANLHAWKLRTGRLRDSSSLSSLTEALDRLSKAKIYTDDHPAATTLHIRSTARRMKKEHDVKLIVVDYLQLVSAYDTKRSDSMVQQVTEISRTLKLIARELNIPVIALSQLSRDIEKRSGRPRLSDLRDSGSIEQDADVVMFLHRNSNDVNNESDTVRTELLIEKHRNGPTGRIELLFDKRHVTFKEEASESYQEIADSTYFDGNEA